MSMNNVHSTKRSCEASEGKSNFNGFKIYIDSITNLPYNQNSVIKHCFKLLERRTAHGKTD